MVILGDEHLAGAGLHMSMDGIAAMDALGKGLDDLAVLLDLATSMPSVVPQSSSRMMTSWRHVDQTAGQVTGVGGTQSRIGQALTGASGGDEVFQHGQALTEVCLDGDLDGRPAVSAIRPRIPAS